MLKSMTGFGRCEKENDSWRISVEMKSVNHRYLELGLKMPKKMNAFEASIRSQLKKDILRGKVDVFITYEDLSQKKGNLRYNPLIAKEYMDAFAEMEKEFGIINKVTVIDLAKCPDVLVMEEEEENADELWHLLSETLQAATDEFVEQRKAEGERLKADLFEKLDNLLEWVAFIEERSPQTLKAYREKLESRIRELIGDNVTIEDSRILTEVTIFADKICVDEETVRLRSHIQAMKDALNEGGSIGRKLDFIAQEMNRESNTILSKANDIEVSQKAILLKTEIEKVREQIQNIE